MLLQNFTKLKKQHEIMLNTFSWSARYWNMGSGNEWGGGELNSSPTLEIIL